MPATCQLATPSPTSAQRQLFAICQMLRLARAGRAGRALNGKSKLLIVAKRANFAYSANMIALSLLLKHPS